MNKIDIEENSFLMASYISVLRPASNVSLVNRISLVPRAF